MWRENSNKYLDVLKSLFSVRFTFFLIIIIEHFVRVKNVGQDIRVAYYFVAKWLTPSLLALVPHMVSFSINCSFLLLLRLSPQMASPSLYTHSAHCPPSIQFRRMYGTFPLGYICQK